MYLRISVGQFEASTAEDVANRLRASESSLRPAVEALPGCRSFMVGIDTRLNYMTNTSLWDSFAAADQMRTLPEMLALRTDFDALGVEFIPITNHDLLWHTEPAGET